MGQYKTHANILGSPPFSSDKQVILQTKKETKSPGI